jgi:sucrose-6-phosphate hydrolase SacC (GH32 family)
MSNLHTSVEPLVSITGPTSPAEANQEVASIQGDMLHIELELAAGDASRYGIEVRRSPDGDEKTSIFYDQSNQTINVDRTTSGNVSSLFPDLGVQGGSLPLQGEDLKLDIFLDKSMIEIYANGYRAITTRAYPARDDSLGVQLWANGSATVTSMQVWQMASAYTQ